MLASLKMSVRKIRAEMGLSQSELAGLAGISSRAIQSYEQEWRQPSDLVERMLLLLLMAHRYGAGLSRFRCWEQKECPPGVRGRCIAYVTRLRLAQCLAPTIVSTDRAGGPWSMASALAA